MTIAMASDEHPRYPVFLNAIFVVASIIVLVLLVGRFLRKKRERHGNSGRPNAGVVQQKQLPDGSHNAPPTSSPVDPKTGHEFEVFLSFRGSDNRKTFTDWLYHSLTDAGIRTFRDNEELRVGEEIGSELMKSIKQSKIAIPIFSKDYASSKWCLKEVEEMVKCLKETRQLIMPIFLDVTPDEVQHQTGSFAALIAQHEKRFGPKMVRGWRHALEEVVKLKGLELNTVANGYIVEQENFKEPGWRSRLWHSEDAVNVLVGQQGTSKVEAIKLEGHHLFIEQQDCVNEEMFKNLPSLKFIELDGVILNGNFQHVFHRLRWLGWHKEKETPSVNFVLDNLIVLDLSRSLTPENWIGGSSIKVGAKLKVLNLRNCRISRTPDFSACPGLEILILESCVELIYVDPSIGLLKNLILLDMRKCLRLKELPKELGSMESLVEFRIDSTEVEELPISGGMKKLEILSANSCRHLGEIPASIGSLMNLKILHLEDCPSLRDLPALPYGLISLKLRKPSSELTFLDLKNLGNLKELELYFSRYSRLKEGCLSSLWELERLFLSSVRISTLPEEMGSFLRLEEIIISECPDLKCIPKLPPSLSVLTIVSCNSLQRLPVSNLKNLSKLYLQDCSEIKEIEGFGDLLSLDSLSILYFPLNKLEGLERLESLNEIVVIGSRVKRLPEISKLKNLRDLCLSNNPELVEIRGLSSLKELRRLAMGGCTSLELLPEMPSCVEELDLAGCKQVSQVEAVAKLTSLRYLTLSRCEALRKLPNLSKLQRLEYLQINYCRRVEEIPGLEELSNLEWLGAIECDALKLPDRSKLKSNRLAIKTKIV